MGPGTGGEYVSTGHLPSPRQVQATVEEAYRRYARDDSGEVSRTYPALGRVPGHLFGICVAGVSGGVYRVGDSRHEFTIMSVAKPFVFALVCDALGDGPVRQKRRRRAAAGHSHWQPPFCESSARSAWTATYGRRARFWPCIDRLDEAAAQPGRQAGSSAGSRSGTGPLHQ